MEEVLAPLGVTEAPQMVAFVRGSNVAEGSTAADHVLHDGEMKPEALAEFLEDHAGAVPEDDAPEERSARVDGKKEDVKEDKTKPNKKSKKSKEPKSPFSLITADKFEDTVLKPEPVVMVAGAYTRLLFGST